NFGDIARRHLGHAYGDVPARPKRAVLHGEAMQGAVRDDHARAREQLMHFREAEPALVRRRRRQPRANLLEMRQQLRLDLARVAIPRRMDATTHVRSQRFRRWLAVRRPPELSCQPLVPTDRAPATPGRSCDCGLTLAA